MTADEMQFTATSLTGVAPEELSAFVNEYTLGVGCDGAPVVVMGTEPAENPDLPEDVAFHALYSVLVAAGSRPEILDRVVDGCGRAKVDPTRLACRSLLKTTQSERDTTRGNPRPVPQNITQIGRTFAPLQHGVVPPATDLFGKGGGIFLSQLTLPPISLRRLEACLRLLDTIAVEVAQADREIAERFRSDPQLSRLLPIPGIGPTIAATILTEIGIASRFDSPDNLCSWAGLTPTEHSSAEQTRRGHISKQGSRWLRWVMVEAAIRGLRDPQLRDFYLRIAHRRGPKIARVALARRLLTLVFYALRDEGGCRAYPMPIESTRGQARSVVVMASRGRP